MVKRQSKTQSKTIFLSRTLRTKQFKCTAIFNQINYLFSHVIAASVIPAQCCASKCYVAARYHEEKKLKRSNSFSANSQDQI